MKKAFLKIAALATVGGALSGCSYDMGLGYASDGYGYGGSGYYDCDPYSPFDRYYDCDNGYGFSNIGYGGGWYDNLWYPGYGFYLFDNYGQRYNMRDNHRRYWGERRHHWYRENRGRDHRSNGYRDNGERQNSGNWGKGNRRPPHSSNGPGNEPPRYQGGPDQSPHNGRHRSYSGQRPNAAPSAPAATPLPERSDGLRHRGRRLDRNDPEVRAVPRAAPVKQGNDGRGYQRPTTEANGQPAQTRANRAARGDAQRPAPARSRMPETPNREAD